MSNEPKMTIVLTEKPYQGKYGLVSSTKIEGISPRFALSAVQTLLVIQQGIMTEYGITPEHLLADSNNVIGLDQASDEMLLNIGL